MNNATAMHSREKATFDPMFEQFRKLVSDRFAAMTHEPGTVILTTNADPDRMVDLYLREFGGPGMARAHHTCRCCFDFIRRYGGLVVYDPAQGRHQSLLWSNAWHIYAPYARAAHNLAKYVEKTSRPDGVFATDLRTLGVERTGLWTHFSVPVHKHLLRSNPSQWMAEMRHRSDTLFNYLTSENRPTSMALGRAITLLERVLYRGDRFVNWARWLTEVEGLAVHSRWAAWWTEVGKAPDGWCMVKASMLGGLLDDIAAGMDEDAIDRRWRERMDPLAYQRPQAPPKAGAVLQAERLFADLGLAPSLERRFLRPDEIPAGAVMWQGRPRRTPESARETGLFAHLMEHGVKATMGGTPPKPPGLLSFKPMTWEKFAREITPYARAIFAQPPSRGPYSALLTAANPDAPPILKWDCQKARNPVNWYFWQGGASVMQFNLAGRSAGWARVEALLESPAHWSGRQPAAPDTDGVFVWMPDAKETRSPALCLFPEILRSELHGVRSVIEAHSNSRKVDIPAGPMVAGLFLHRTMPTAWPLKIAVQLRDPGAPWLYLHIDRWD